MVSFAKGHGTRNDFVLLSDPDNVAPLSAEQVRFLCDRRGGIGADGVLRAVRARHVDAWDGDPDVWFMDYRNADGSIAEMCGNGLRVFARYLADEGHVPAATRTLTIGTRSGLRSAELLDDGRVRVWMGRPRLGAEVHVSASSTVFAAISVDVGNPHAVAFLPTEVPVTDLDLTTEVSWEPAIAFPDGVNAEFVETVGAQHIRMRVVERGVGETESCGTGTVAAAVAASRRTESAAGTWRVDVPGGSVEVELRDGQAWLTGPAVIVAHGEVELPREVHR